MLIKRIRFQHGWKDIDIENDNINVFVELEDGYIYVVRVATPKNLESFMEKEKRNYFKPGIPVILVQKLTKEIIEETIQAYAAESNGYWLKSYHFAEDIPKSVFNKLKAEHIEYLKEFDDLLHKDFNKSRVRDQFYYNQKEQYRRPIHDYLSGKIIDTAFVVDFFEIYKQDTKDFELLSKDWEKLISFSIESKSEGFSGHLDDIFENCDSLGFDPDNIASHEIDESQFRLYLERIYSQMQKYFDT